MVTSQMRPSFAPVVSYFAAELRADHPLHYARAEALTRRRFHGRATGFRPSKEQLSRRLKSPFDLNAACGLRQRAVLDGVGRELVEGERHGLGRRLLQHQARTFNPCPLVAIVAIGGKLLNDQVVQIDAGPARSRERSTSVGERPQPAFYRRAQFVCRLGVRQMDGGLRQGQQVLRSMVRLAGQQIDLLLPPLLFGDVARDLGGTDGPTGLVGNRRYRQRYREQASVLAPAHRLEMVDAFAAPDTLQNPNFLILTIRRNRIVIGLPMTSSAK